MNKIQHYLKKEEPVLDKTGFFFCIRTPVKDEVRINTRVRIRKMKPVLSNTGNLFCFNSNVSNLYIEDAIIYKIK
jgi:hypothetical protein